MGLYTVLKPGLKGMNITKNDLKFKFFQNKEVTPLTINNNQTALDPPKEGSSPNVCTQKNIYVVGSREGSVYGTCSNVAHRCHMFFSLP